MQSFGELAHRPLLVDLTVEDNTRLKVIYGSCDGFHAVDLDSATVYDIYLPKHVRLAPGSVDNLADCHSNAVSISSVMECEVSLMFGWFRQLSNHSSTYLTFFLPLFIIVILILGLTCWRFSDC